MCCKMIKRISSKKITGNIHDYFKIFFFFYPFLLCYRSLVWFPVWVEFLFLDVAIWNFFGIFSYVILIPCQEWSLSKTFSTHTHIYIHTLCLYSIPRMILRQRYNCFRPPNAEYILFDLLKPLVKVGMVHSRNGI